LAGGSACPTRQSGTDAFVCQPAALASKKEDDRRYPKRPIIGVGALIFRRGRILMAQRGKQPMKGAWSLPGGALEIGESLDAAIRREVREETGLEVKPVKVFEIFERIMRDSRGAPEYHYVLIDYICRVVGGDLRAGDDVCRVEWVLERDLPKLEITEGTLAVIERAFKVKRGTDDRFLSSVKVSHISEK
jgi:mutator protein MutT